MVSLGNLIHHLTMMLHGLINMKARSKPSWHSMLDTIPAFAGSLVSGKAPKSAEETLHHTPRTRIRSAQSLWQIHHGCVGLPFRPRRVGLERTRRRARLHGAGTGMVQQKPWLTLIHAEFLR